MFSGTTFKVPSLSTTSTTGGTPAPRTETGRVTNSDGSVTISYSDGTTEIIPAKGNQTIPDPATAALEQNRRSAFAILEKEFTDNNLTTLIPEIKRFMTEGYGAEEASLLLPTTEAYKTRFAGNEGRKALGLPTYTPGQYLVAEQTYRDLFNQYNLGELANQNTYNALIGGAVSVGAAVPSPGTLKVVPENKTVLPDDCLAASVGFALIAALTCATEIPKSLAILAGVSPF